MAPAPEMWLSLSLYILGATQADLDGTAGEFHPQNMPMQPLRRIDDAVKRRLQIM